MASINGEQARRRCRYCESEMRRAERRESRSKGQAQHTNSQKSKKVQEWRKRKKKISVPMFSWRPWNDFVIHAWRCFSSTPFSSGCWLHFRSSRIDNNHAALAAPSIATLVSCSSPSNLDSRIAQRGSTEDNYNYQKRVEEGRTQ